MDAYAKISFDSIGRGEGWISIVQEEKGYSVYLSNERGSVKKEADNVSESDACTIAIDLIKRRKAIYEKNF